MEQKKRQRGCNMTFSEKALLADLVVKHSAIVENKRTDAVSSQVKTKCWVDLAAEFNATSMSGVQRDALQLKHAYENLKQKAKKSVSDCKVAQLQTGGGPCVPLPDDVTEKVLMVLGNRAKPLENCFDSDAAYNCEAGANDAVTFPIVLIHDAVQSAEAVVGAQSTSDNVLSTNPAVHTISAGAAATAASETATVSAATTTALSSSSAAAAAGSRQCGSTNRRRPARRPFRSSANQDAAEKMSAAASIQADYYKEKLAIKRQQHELFLEEHAKRMHVLDLQEQLIVRQLQKLEE